jgi:carboxyl-terminal processing protease
MPLTRSEREQLLRHIDDSVQQKFYDPHFNGRNWKEIVAQHRQQIIDSDSDVAFEAAVTDMLDQLGSSGLGILGPHTPVTPRSSINASFRAVYTDAEGLRWAFQDVLPGGVADRAGVKPADLLIAIGPQELEPPVSPAFEMGNRTEIVISRAGEKRALHIDLTTPQPKYRSNPYSEPKSVVASLLDGSIANLKVSLFPGYIGMEFANKVSAAFNGILRDAKRLLIDLRGNPGGGIGGLRVMSYLTPYKTPIGFSLDRPMAEHGYDRDKLPRFGHIPRFKFELLPLALKFGRKRSIALVTEGLGRHPFHGHVAILVNEHSTGAAEMLAQFAQENRLATIIGSKTAGRLVSRSGIKIGNGYTLVLPVAAYMSWSGVRIEGNGITPDVPADWSYEAALDGRDTQFEKAVANLKAA